MRSVITLLKKELLTMFVSPVAYCAVTGFVLVAGFLFFSFLGGFNHALAQYASLPLEARKGITLNEYVIEQYYHGQIFMMIFLAPLLTMRAFAEERRRGTFELLLTSPLSIGQIVLGKFLAAAAVVLLMCLLGMCFPLLLCTIADPEVQPMLCGLVGVILCSVAFVSVAMAVSCFTDSQIVAGVSGTVVLLLLYVIFSPAPSLGPEAQALLDYLSPVRQADVAIRGTLSLKTAVYFLSLTVFGVFAAQRCLDLQRGK